MTFNRLPDDATLPVRSADDDADPAERPRRPPRSRRVWTGVRLVVLALLVLVGAGAVGSGVMASPTADPTPALETEPTDAVTADGPVDVVRQTGGSNVTGSFSRSVFTGVAGDSVDVTHSAGGDDTYLLIGGNRLTNSGQSVGFVDVVKPGSDDTVTINTRTLGTAESTVESCGDSNVSCDIELLDEDGTVRATNLSGFPGATGAGGLSRPIVPERYRLAITNGTFILEDSGQITPAETAARSELVLGKPTIHDEVETFTTAAADDTSNGDGGSESLEALAENGLDRTAVTTGDRVVLGFEASGIWGVLSHFAENRSEEMKPGEAIDPTVLSDVLEVDEGVTLRIEQTNPGRNRAPSEVDLSNADPDGVSLILDDANEIETSETDPGRFYLVLDTGPNGPFTETPAPGDEFDVEFTLEGTDGERYRFDGGNGLPAAFEPESATNPDVPEQFPYWERDGGRVSAETSFTVRERFIRYNDVTGDGTLLVEADDGSITGRTSILPATEMTADVVNDDGEPIRTQSPMEIEDGNFSIETPLDDVSPGTRLSYELYEGSTFKESRTALVVDDVDAPDRLAITDAPATVTVTEDDDLSTLEAEVTNVGGLAGDGTLTLDVDDGNVTATEELTVESNESRRVDFSSARAALTAGEYPFTLTLDADELNGTVVVESDPAKTTLDDDNDSEEPDDGDDPAGSETDDGDDPAGSETDDGDDPAGSDDGNGTDDPEEPPEPGVDTDAPDDERPSEDASTTIVPFGIGAREAFGGTAVVGAVYVAGHWI